MNKYIYFIAAAALIAAAVALTACKKDKVAVTGVTLNKTTLALEEGKSEKLTSTVQPADATNQRVSWNSDNTTVAIVDASGNVAALKAGSAKITVTTESGKKTATCTVTVTPAAVPRTNVTFTAVQKGGAENTASSTGINLTFSVAVTGLTAEHITIENGTGAATKGGLTGSGANWTIALIGVSPTFSRKPPLSIFVSQKRPFIGTLN